MPCRYLLIHLCMELIFLFCFPAPQPQSKADGTQGGVITDRRVVEEQLVQGVTVGVQKGGR